MDIASLPFKTKPFAHQLRALYASWDKTAFALLMEMGTGKTKVILDNAAMLFLAGKIDCLLIVAPNGVHRNWVEREVPKHYFGRYVSAYWKSSFSIKRRFAFNETAFAPIYTANTMLRIIAMNYDAFITEAGVAFLRRLLTEHKCMMILDESTKIKTPSAKRTKAIISAGKLAPYRRILTGTPVGNSLFELYSQFKFLDMNIIGFKTFTEFKSYFGEFRLARAGNNQFMEFVKYKHEDELKEKVLRHSFQAKKKDCLDLPDKIYEQRLVEMSNEQARIYGALKSEFVAAVEGGTMIAALALTRIMRLQQITGGFVAAVDGTLDEILNGDVANETRLRPIDGVNPKMTALMEILENVEGKAIIWARFQAEIEMICAQIQAQYGPDSVVAYYGKTSAENRHKAESAFQEGTARFFVGQPASGGYGLNLFSATTVIYYSNTFSLSDREQSEDRAHRQGQKHNVTYIDMVMADTVDGKILAALNEKKNLAAYIKDTGEKYFYGTGNNE